MGSGSAQDTRSNRSCTSAVPAHEALYEVLAVRRRVADEGNFEPAAASGRSGVPRSLHFLHGVQLLLKHRSEPVGDATDLRVRNTVSASEAGK
jgi:hypothetical protein